MHALVASLTAVLLSATDSGKRWNDVLYTLTEGFLKDAFEGVSCHVVQIPHQGTEDHHWLTAREELHLFL